MTDRTTALAALRQLATRETSRTYEVRGGLALSTPRLGPSLDHNRIWFDNQPSATAAMRISGQHARLERLTHRAFTLNGPVAQHFGQFLLEKGWTRHRVTIMELSGALASRRGSVRGIRLTTLDTDRSAALQARGWYDGQVDESEILAAFSLHHEITREHATWYQAARGSVELGHMRLASVEEYLVLEDLVVYPRAQGTGTGTALLQHAVDLARADGLSLLLTADSHRWPRQWYRRVGFSELGSLSTFWKC